MKIDRIYNEDCLEGMKRIDDASIDCIICDLPYGTSASSWDKQIPMAMLWEQYCRIIKSDGAIVLFAQQPFTSLLICSNIGMYKYNWVWQKDNATNFLNANYQPMKITEDICVFSKAPTSYTKSKTPMKYNPQKESGKPYVCKTGRRSEDVAVTRGNVHAVEGYETVNNGDRMPKNILRYNRDKDKLHPTQKPVELIRYLIRTYSNPDDVILDNTIGSGTTAIAAIREHRHYIGFELNKEYYDKACERIEREQQQPTLF